MLDVISFISQNESQLGTNFIFKNICKKEKEKYISEHSWKLANIIMIRDIVRPNETRFRQEKPDFCLFDAGWREYSTKIAEVYSFY